MKQYVVQSVRMTCRLGVVLSHLIILTAFVYSLSAALHMKRADGAELDHDTHLWTIAVIEQPLPFCVAMRVLAGVGILSIGRSKDGVIVAIETEKLIPREKISDKIPIRVGESRYGFSRVDGHRNAVLLRGKEALAAVSEILRGQEISAELPLAFTARVDGGERIVRSLAACAGIDAIPAVPAASVDQTSLPEIGASAGGDQPSWERYDQAIKTQVETIKEVIWQDWRDRYPPSGLKDRGHRLNQ